MMASKSFAPVIDLLSMYLFMVLKKTLSVAQTRWCQIIGQIMNKKDVEEVIVASCEEKFQHLPRD
jgi:hypothetical protein